VGSAGGALPGSILPPGNWAISVHDEFNGTSLDTSIWISDATDVGFNSGGGWYTDNAQALSFGGGLMTMTTFPKPPGVVLANPPNGEGGGRDTLIRHPRRHVWEPGYYESRLKSARTDYSIFWVQGMGADCSQASDGVEADMPEANYNQGQTLLWFHWSGYGSCHQQGGMTTVTDGINFHVYGLDYDATNGMTYYVDGVAQSFRPGALDSGRNVHEHRRV